MLIQYSYFNIRYSNINRMKLSSFPIKERGTKCPFVRLLDMKKKERMKIYTLLFGILFVSPTQAQTMHDWENHHVLQINREPARAAFTPFLCTERRRLNLFRRNLEIPLDSRSQ